MPFSELDKTGWTVTTVAIDQNGENYKYMWDGGDAECTTKDAHITGNPEHIFDDMANTYLCFVKPGGNRLGIELPATANAPYFVVDMQQEQAFNAIKWVHRNGSYGSATNKIAPVLDFEGRATGALGFVGSNNYAYLHVFGIILEGSNDNETFTIIPPTEATNEDNIIWIPQSPNTYRSGNAASPNPNIIPVTQSTYRYLRVTCKVHSRNYGNGEGKYVHPDDNSDVAVSTGGETMQVAEFGVGSEIIFDDQE
jgi:hypothetical protein